LKEIGFDALRRWTSRGLQLSTADGSALRSMDDTNSFTLLVGRALELTGARSAADIGCGCGIPTIEAAARGARQVLGVDIDAKNVKLARRNVLRANFGDRIELRCADWSGSLLAAPPELVVTNPPYVPEGGHPAVDGGADGAAAIRAIVNAVPESTRHLALLFGSISNPLAVLRQLDEGGWQFKWLAGHVVPFGRYTRQPATLAALRRLKLADRAWFHESPRGSRDVQRRYIVFGAVVTRGSGPASLDDAVAGLLTRFQRAGLSGLEAAALPVPFELGAYRAALTAPATRVAGNGTPPGRLRRAASASGDTLHVTSCDELAVRDA
jgi:SAM-dependent methyltransferase